MPKPKTSHDAAVSILANFLERHGVSAADAAQMTAQQFALTANLCRLQATPDQTAVVGRLVSREMQREQAAEEFRKQLARLERQTR